MHLFSTTSEEVSGDPKLRKKYMLNCKCKITDCTLKKKKKKIDKMCETFRTPYRQDPHNCQGLLLPSVQWQLHALMFFANLWLIDISKAPIYK